MEATTTVFSQLDTLWVLLAGFLVMLMQAGFLLLEIGFSRAKNAGTVVAKVLVNFAIAAIVWWALGFGVAFGEGGWLAGTSDFFFSATTFTPQTDALVHPAAFFFFQFAFAGVSLAIVWGTTLERIKFGAYLIYAVIFAAVIYPVGAHWIFGGGWLAEIGGGVQDFAGSTVIHLVGATGAFAALLLLGPRQGKYGPDGRPNVIPGHAMPLVGLGVIILWFGWFGFNAGSTITTADGRFAEVAIVTQLGAAGGVIGAALLIWLLTRTFDIGMVGNGAIGGLVGITAPSGYVELWAAPIIGFVAGLIVVAGVILIDKVLDDPVGALSAHGLAGIWGTLACGLFTSTRLAEVNGIGQPGLFYNGDFEQLGIQALGVTSAFAFVFTLSFVVFFAIKATYGLRVKPEEERYGLDIVEHGMWGYPEQFMPVPGYEYHQPTPPAGRAAPRPAPVGLGTTSAGPR